MNAVIVKTNARSTVDEARHANPTAAAGRASAVAAASCPVMNTNRLWSEMRRRWQSGDRVRVESYLASPGFPADDRGLILDLVYAEFALSQEFGEAPRADEYCERFPELRDELSRQLMFHSGMQALQETAIDVAAHVGSRPADLLPQSIGKYRVLAQLGRGGQATVYRAFDPALQREVVLKRAHHRVDQGDANRLNTEGTVLTEVRHPNLVAVHGLEFDGDTPFLVMEYIPGRSLEQCYVADGCAPNEAAAIVAALASAVAAAHRHGVYHLDIKPANVLLDQTGQPRLVDFGVAHVEQFWSGTNDDDSIGGTIPFMAPEQLANDSSLLGPRTDVYGLGALLYFLLTGRAPVGADEPGELLQRVRAGRWDRLALQAASASERLKRICQRALATDPAGRYRSAEAMAADLESLGRPRPRSAVLAFAGIGLAAAFLTAWLAFGPQSPPVVAVAQQVIAPPVRLRVWDEDRFRDAVHCLPLRTGNEVRLEAECPPGWHVGWFWRDTEGRLHARGATQTAAPDLLVTDPPAQGKAIPLTGRAGTEFVFLVGSREGPIVAADIQPLLDSEVWPALPDDRLLRLDVERVTALGTSRRPGPLTDRADPEAELMRRLEVVRRQLRAKYELVTGIAFSHR